MENIERGGYRREVSKRSRCFKRKRLIALPITDNATINDLRGACGEEGGLWGLGQTECEDDQNEAYGTMFAAPLHPLPSNLNSPNRLAADYPNNNWPRFLNRTGVSLQVENAFAWLIPIVCYWIFQS